jgi:hypothetical protein
VGAYFGGLFVLLGLLSVSHRLGQIANALRDLANRR